MPLITSHTSSEEQRKFLTKVSRELRIFAAKKLSCGDRALAPEEISIRIINSEPGSSIGDIELMIVAYSYKERVDNQDKICLDIRKFLEEKCNKEYKIFVWLQLSELGHSL